MAESELGRTQLPPRSHQLLCLELEVMIARWFGAKSTGKARKEVLSQDTPSPAHHDLGFPREPVLGSSHHTHVYAHPPPATAVVTSPPCPAKVEVWPVLLEISGLAPPPGSLPGCQTLCLWTLSLGLSFPIRHLSTQSYQCSCLLSPAGQACSLLPGHWMLLTCHSIGALAPKGARA